MKQIVYLKKSGCIWLFLLLLLAISCEREMVVLDNYNNGTDYVAVHCFVGPDENSIKLRAEMALSVIGKPYRQLMPITDAVAYILSDNDSMAFTFDNMENYFYAFPNAGFFKPNKTYTLHVQSPGNGNVHATCIIPPVNDVLQVAQQTTLHKEDSNRFLIQTKVSITDHPGQTNYYRIIPLAIARDPNVMLDTMYVNFNQGLNGCFVSDAGKNGQTLTTTIDFNYTAFGSEQIYGMRIMVINCSEAYFKYHNAINSVGFGGVLGEPTIMPTNIVNGIGMFAGYSTVAISDYFFE